MKRVDDYKYFQHLIIDCHVVGNFEYYLIGLNKKHSKSFIRFLHDIEKLNSEIKKQEIVEKFGAVYLFMLGTNMNMSAISQLLIMTDEWSENHILRVVINKSENSFDLKVMDKNDSGLKQFSISFII